MLTASFGSRSTFAIECRIDYWTDTPARNAVGEVTFWAGGRQIGNPDVVSTLGIAEKDIESTLRWRGNRYDPLLYRADKTAVLDSVFHHAYELSSYDDDALEKGDRFLACMHVSGNEWTDGWLIVLVEADRTSSSSEGTPSRDRLLYRVLRDRSDHEFWLPAGEYARVAEEFLHWLAPKSTLQGRETE